MKIFFTESVVETIQKLEKKPSYSNLRLLFYECIQNRKNWNAGRRLNPGQPIPHIKCRLQGSGGYRFYYIIVVKDNEVIISALYPKTGKKGKANLDTQEIKHSMTDAVKAFLKGPKFPVQLDHDNNTIIF